MGYTTITPGTTIASTWGNEVRDQLVTPVGNATTRSALIASPVNGQLTTITAANSSNGIEQFNGVSWRLPWNMPWGYVTSATPASFNFNTTIGYSATFSVPMVNNRRYKFSITGRFENSTVTGVVDNLALYLNTGNVLVQSQIFMVTQSTANGQNAGTGTVLYVTNTTGAVVFKLGAASTASATNQQYITTGIIVEDIGPGGAPV